MQSSLLCDHCLALPADAVVYGLCSILLLTPLIGVLVVQLPLQPPSLALGLGVFAAMPTALSSGVTFTQVSTLTHNRARGNHVLALIAGAYCWWRGDACFCCCQSSRRCQD